MLLYVRLYTPSAAKLEEVCSIWQLLAWADGPRNLNFKWNQILREELSFGVRGHLEMRCQTQRMMGEVRMEREALYRTEATGENMILFK